MKSTVAEVNELVKKLKDECFSFLNEEKRSRDFSTSTGADAESICPVYNYENAQVHLSEIKETIRTLKHTIDLLETAGELPRECAKDQQKDCRLSLRKLCSYYGGNGVRMICR